MKVIELVTILLQLWPIHKARNGSQRIYCISQRAGYTGDMFIDRPGAPNFREIVFDDNLGKRPITPYTYNLAGSNGMDRLVKIVHGRTLDVDSGVEVRGNPGTFGAMCCKCPDGSQL